jgi:hypothetical protein
MSGAEKPVVQMTVAPPTSEVHSPATRPWMWKSGMTLQTLSAGDSESVRTMAVAEAIRFRLVKGTIFGREVVPDVWSTKATSSIPVRCPEDAADAVTPSTVIESEVPVTFDPMRITGMPAALAAWVAGSISASPSPTTMAARPRSSISKSNSPRR